MEPIVIEGLTKRYGSILALDDLNLKVPPRSCVGFLGPNGSGKTTTIKILTNLLRANSGRAFLNGTDVTEDPKTALAGVGAVVETPELYPELTPVELLRFFARLRGLSPEDTQQRTNQVLAQVKMKRWKDYSIETFSKGMKQRIVLAQALLHEPEILILDEPTVGLDPRGMAEVRKVIINLRRAGYTIFMSSHLLAEVQQICDYVAVLNRGKLLVFDTIDNLAQLVTVTKLEVDTVNAMSREMYDEVCKMTGVTGVQCPTNNKMFIDFEGDLIMRSDTLVALQGIGLKIHSFKESGVALENLYLKLVKESK